MKVKPTYLFFDVETTGYTPSTAEMITIAIYITDENYNILGTFYEECTIGHLRHQENVLGYIVDLWPDQATEVHGITFEQQLKFQLPIHLYRKLYVFLEQWPDDKLTMVYHSNGTFDTSFLFYRADIHAPKMYRYLTRRFSTYEIDINTSEHVNGIRHDNTMKMARAYRKKGSDWLTLSTKYQKQIDKFNGYLTKIRKTPAKPAKLLEWKEKLAIAEKAKDALSPVDVQFEGVSLDKICKALNIPLRHHDARSDARVLIDIHKFFSAQME